MSILPTDKPGRPPDPVKRQRVAEILNLRLNGAEFHDLRAHADEAGWKNSLGEPLSDRTLWRYSEAAEALAEKHFSADRDRLFRRHVLQRRALYARAMADGDYRTALAVAKDEAELQGLYAPKKMELTGKVALTDESEAREKLAQASLEELRQLRALRNRIFGLSGGAAGRDGAGQASG
jgi:hypothetical protein